MARCHRILGVRYGALLLLALAGTSCAVPRPHELKDAAPDSAVFAVKSCRLHPARPWVTKFAHHGFVDYRTRDGQWHRLELIGDDMWHYELDPEDAFGDLRYGEREVRLWRHWEGDEAAAMIDAVLADLPRIESEFVGHYMAWPGPNSNGFVREILRVAGGHAPAHHNALGKDHTWLLDAGVSHAGTGVHVDLLPVGFTLGLEEGVELHLLQLTFGVSLWPPRLKLPFLPELPWPADVDDGSMD